MNWINNVSGEHKGDLDNKTPEEIYIELKNENSDKDGHWLLANTWLVKYVNLQVAKQKGPKLTRYIAYTTTFQWALVDSPDSIKGLSLYLAYKERGDKESDNEDETRESARIIESIQNIMSNSNLLEIYKNKNPFTWNEVLVENNESIHGLLGFLKTADFLSKNPEEQRRVTENLEKLDIGEKIQSLMNNIELSEEQIAEIKRSMEKDQ